MDLGALHGDVNFVIRLERVVTADADQINVFREDQRDQHGHGKHDFSPGERGMGRHGVASCSRRVVNFIPGANLDQDDDGDQRGDREPRDAVLTFWQNDESREQRTGGGACVAAYLKQGLREACCPPDANRAMREDSGWNTAEADADQRDCGQDRQESGRRCEKQESRKRKSHANGGEYGFEWASVYHADQRLEQRCRDLQAPR